MKTEVFQKLMPFEKLLHSALHSNYARFRAPELEQFSQVLNEHRGSPLSRQERSCGHCFLVTLKKVAQEYDTFAASPKGKQFLKSLEEPENVEESQSSTQSETITTDGSQD